MHILPNLFYNSYTYYGFNKKEQYCLSKYQNNIDALIHIQKQTYLYIHIKHNII